MERQEVESKYKWKVSDIYSSDEAWEDAYKKAEKLLDFEKFVGTLGDVEKVIELFNKQEKASKILERLYLYAHMRHDEDSRDAKYTSMQSRAMSLYVKFSSAVSFVEPELTLLSDDKLKEFAQDSRLSDYDYFFKRLIEGKEHILSSNEEKLLAMGGEVYSQFKEIFS